MTIEIRAVIQLKSLSLTGAPLADEEPYRALSGTDFEFKLVVDVKLAQIIGEITADQLRNKGSTLPYSGIHAFLRATCSEELEADIHAQKATSETRQFGEKLLDAIESIHDSLVDFARHEHGRWHVPVRVPRESTLDQQLHGYDVRFYGEYEGKVGWVLLKVTNDPITIRASMDTGIKREAWNRWVDSLAGGPGFKVRPYKRMLANAYAHLHNNDFRAAVVEAVAAWEIYLVQDGPQYLASRYGIIYSTERWSKLISKALLTASTQLFLAFAGIDAPDLITAIALRNEVVHRGARKQDKAGYTRAVSGVAKALKAIEGE